MDGKLRELLDISENDFDVVVRITREEDIAIARQMLPKSLVFLLLM